MKKMIKILHVMLLMILFAAINVMAEEIDEPEKPEREVDTLFGNVGDGDLFVSGYGALIPSYTRIKGKDAMLMGGRGGLIIENFVFGISGAGLVHPNKAEDFTSNTLTDDEEYVNFGYGGAMIEYYFFPRKLVHFSIGTTVGAGGLHFSSDDDDDDDERGGDAFFAVEPEANIFINVTRFCRLGIGGSYRYIKGIDNDIFEDEDFSGANVKFIAAFGWF